MNRARSALESRTRRASLVIAICVGSVALTPSSSVGQGASEQIAEDCRLAFVAQKEKNWCWAAVGETTMNWMSCRRGDRPTDSYAQHRQVTQRYRPSQGACEDTECGEQLDACRKTGWPQYEEHGFELVGSCDGGSGLAWAELREELISGRPIAFAYRSTRASAGHMVLLHGLVEKPGGIVLLGFDPYPPCGGEARYAIGLSDYRAGADRVHWRSYFGWGERIRTCVDDGGAGDPLGVIADSARDAVRAALRELVSDSGEPLRRHLALVGSPDPEHGIATSVVIPVSDPTPAEICSVDPRVLDPIALSRELYLVQVGGEPLGIEVDGTRGGWRLGTYEISKLTRRLARAAAERSDKTLAGCLLVRVPGINRRLLWCGTGVSRSVCDLDVDADCKSQSEGSANAVEELLQDLRDEACRFDGGAPS